MLLIKVQISFLLFWNFWPTDWAMQQASLLSHWGKKDLCKSGNFKVTQTLWVLLWVKIKHNKKTIFCSAGSNIHIHIVQLLHVFSPTTSFSSVFQSQLGGMRRLQPGQLKTAHLTPEQAQRGAGTGLGQQDSLFPMGHLHSCLSHRRPLSLPPQLASQFRRTPQAARLQEASSIPSVAQLLPALGWPGCEDGDQLTYFKSGGDQTSTANWELQPLREERTAKPPSPSAATSQLQASLLVGATQSPLCGHLGTRDQSCHRSLYAPTSQRKHVT